MTYPLANGVAAHRLISQPRRFRRRWAAAASSRPRIAHCAVRGAPSLAYSTALTISSTTFLASPKTIIVLSM